MTIIMNHKILIWAGKNQKTIKTLSIILNILTILLIASWILKMFVKILADIDFEAILACITPVALSINQINRKLLEDSEYSPAGVLAYGYVYNFILPVITQLKEDNVARPKICIYKTDKISDLTEKNIDLLKADLKNKNYILSEIKLNLKQARARDILTIERGRNQVYFDFPNTLLSLFSYIDYKLDTKSNSHAEKEKVQLASKLMAEFYETLDQLLIDNRLTHYVTYCDFNMKIFG